MKTKDTLDAYQFVTGVHGTEYMPTLALASLGVRQIVGNPRALALRKRFVDSDLNKAFGKDPTDYETSRACEILALLSDDKPVVDIHSFSGPSPAFVIVVETEMLDLALCMGIQRIVYMKFSTKGGHALINYRKGVTVETGLNGSKESFETTVRLINTLQEGHVSETTEYEFYEVYERITTEGPYRNFELYQDEHESFYPILTGEVSAGLKARKVDHFGDSK